MLSSGNVAFALIFLLKLSKRLHCFGNKAHRFIILQPFGPRIQSSVATAISEKDYTKGSLTSSFIKTINTSFF